MVGPRSGATVRRVQSERRIFPPWKNKPVSPIVPIFPPCPYHRNQNHSFVHGDFWLPVPLPPSQALLQPLTRHFLPRDEPTQQDMARERILAFLRQGGSTFRPKSVLSCPDSPEYESLVSCSPRQPKTEDLKSKNLFPRTNTSSKPEAYQRPGSRERRRNENVPPSESVHCKESSKKLSAPSVYHDRGKLPLKSSNSSTVTNTEVSSSCRKVSECSAKKKNSFVNSSEKESTYKSRESSDSGTSSMVSVPGVTVVNISNSKEENKIHSVKAQAKNSDVTKRPPLPAIPLTIELPEENRQNNSRGLKVVNKATQVNLDRPSSIRRCVSTVDLVQVGHPLAYCSSQGFAVPNNCSTNIIVYHGGPSQETSKVVIHVGSEKQENEALSSKSLSSSKQQEKDNIYTSIPDILNDTDESLISGIYSSIATDSNSFMYLYKPSSRAHMSTLDFKIPLVNNFPNGSAGESSAYSDNLVEEAWPYTESDHSAKPSNISVGSKGHLKIDYTSSWHGLHHIVNSPPAYSYFRPSTECIAKCGFHDDASSIFDDMWDSYTHYV